MNTILETIHHILVYW